MGAAYADNRPNIILMIWDDYDYEMFGFQGDRFAYTPATDALVASEAVFPFGSVSNATCRSSLATLLSGKYPHENGVLHSAAAIALDPNNAMPAMLRDAGYATFAGGKFWEPYNPPDPNLAPPPDPSLYGFDYSEEAHAGRNPIYGTNSFVREGQPLLLDFVENLDPNTPFFVWWSPLLPHVPHNAPQDYFDLLRDPNDPNGPPLAPGDLPAPAWVTHKLQYRQEQVVLYAMAAWTDAGAAELLAKVEEVGRLNNTLVITMVDNGWANAFVSKNSPFEKGIRTHYSFTLPGLIHGGQVRPELVAEVDIPATILDFAGVPIPPSYSGHSVRPLIDPTVSPSDPPVAWDRSNGGAWGKDLSFNALHLRTERHKLILWFDELNLDDNAIHEFTDIPPRTGGDVDLYDLSVDPYEFEDIAEEPFNAALVEELRGELLDWWYLGQEQPNPCPADVNYDDRIDSTDLSLVLTSFGAYAGHSKYVRRRDLNGDGSIDATDLSLLLASFGAACDRY